MRFSAWRFGFLHIAHPLPGLLLWPFIKDATPPTVHASLEEAGALAKEFQSALQVGGPRRYWQKNLEITLKEYKQAGTGYFPAIGVAGAYARVGDIGNAFKWLDKSFEDREGQDITLVRWLPDFKSLHADPRFADLLRRMGLPN